MFGGTIEVLKGQSDAEIQIVSANWSKLTRHCDGLCRIWGRAQLGWEAGARGEDDWIEARN
jgi:hypothetical protein